MLLQDWWTILWCCCFWQFCIVSSIGCALTPQKTRHHEFTEPLLQWAWACGFLSCNIAFCGDGVFLSGNRTVAFLYQRPKSRSVCVHSTCKVQEIDPWCHRACGLSVCFVSPAETLCSMWPAWCVPLVVSNKMDDSVLLFSVSWATTSLSLLCEGDDEWRW